VIGGVFDEALMGLPSRLLITSMKVHQRYFPIFEQGELTHHFAVVSNNPWGDVALIAQGNARVLRARFYDARFFLAEDQRVPLTAFSDQLVKMRWIKGLGSMAQKQARLAVLAPKIAALLGASDQAAADAGRAGGQCKADLVTQMVGEFSDLQGHMGRIYAAAAGERPEVAAAIEEHYRPKGASDAVPTAPASVALALADRLDTLAGCFGVGMVPKGSGDPQGLRRAAAGVLALLESGAARLPLADLFGQAVGVLHAQTVAEPEGFEAWAKRHGVGASSSAHEALVDELITFAVARFKASAVAAGATGDRVDAILAVTAPEPTLLRAKVAALERVAGTPAFEPILRTFKRVLNITATLGGTVEGAGERTDPAEHALGDALDAAAAAVAQASASLDFDAVLAAVVALEAPVAQFFEAVMVDDPDPQKKAARVGLLLRAATLFRTFADFTRVSTR